MKCLKRSKGMMRLACWLVAILLLAGCGGGEGDLTAPQLTFDGAGAGTTARTRYLSGSVEAGATVEVMVGTDSVPASQVHVAGSRWSCVVDTLQAGANLVIVTATDSSGNQNILSFILTYDALTIDDYVTPISGSTLTIGGLFDPSSQAPPQVTVGTGTPAAATVAGNHWSFALTGLAAGDNAISVSVTPPDLAAVTKPLTVNVNADAPLVTIDSVTSPTVSASQALSGTWAGDADPVVTVPTATLGNLTADASTGIWGVDLTDLGAGKNTVAVSATANGITATAHALITQQIFTDRLPYAGAYDVDTGTSVKVTFSENMNANSITGTTFTLSAGTSPVPANVSYEATTRTATLTPTSSLDSATDYTVTLTNAVQNADGNPLAHPVTWVFTTL